MSEMGVLFANQTISIDLSLTVLSDNCDGMVMVNDKLAGMSKETVVD